MDSITHTLFGLALYGSVDKRKMERKQKLAWLATSVGASHIPDIDVVSQLWDLHGQYQMWHRGLTHSLFFTPVWAFLFYILAIWLFKTRDIKLFFFGWLAVLIHITSDLCNAWGTGYLEPFSHQRISFGTIPIVDLVFWVIILAAFLLTRRNQTRASFYYRAGWVLIAVHVFIQSLQGYFLFSSYEKLHEQIALSADFVPTSFTVIAKDHTNVTIYKDGLFEKRKELYKLYSAENTHLDNLFSKKPEAKTLYQWSPFVVIVNTHHRLGIYDPRFYRNGQSFLYEYISKVK
ncbi:metal-dependent hydrolase [Neobacillus terrae]|uniref:metal-dependent hydrolase n=1 Tax=Neobacillus terrae TaxID=3034837 RepID=UPI0014099CAF|nr:metal-dependent hydrolase [Neobacillus terrae]NHM29541.1 metal-dependent hydrolase [Neobacillus terrae]